ncbi:TonB-dependent receptor domain-containing protein [Brytella acorum]|uniref:TonB-dependent receptor domain-containing protein n=1 Tax=Brytella acorum TaxID=2959299 RepID=UPI0025AE8D93|nr:TonB-dependent receptor [Brytella acorum]MDF3623520.1 TonB-dependent receptor [Brytella acorum]
MKTNLRHRDVTTRHRLSKVAFRLFLLGGISYASFPVDGAMAQTSAAGTTQAHKHVGKKHVARKKAAKASTASSTSTTVTPASSAPASASPAAAGSQTVATTTSSKTDALSHDISGTGTEQIVVTGSRLSHTRLTNVMAGVTVDAEQLRKRGYTDLGLALLRENTAFSVGSNSPIGSQGSFGAGQTLISLLNLGSQRNLTLINGMRMVGGSTASMYGASSGSAVDVSTIPVSLISSMDTRLGGAGAAYGADAVAGVTNYILDDHFKGVDFNAQGNWTQRLQAPQQRISFKYGTSFDHDKGGVVFDVEYRNAGGMLQNDLKGVTGRDAVTYGRPTVGDVSTSDYTYVLMAKRRFTENSVTGMPMVNAAYGHLPVVPGNSKTLVPGMATANGIAGANGAPLMFSQDGKSLVPFTADAMVYDSTHSIGGNGIALQDYTQLFAPTDKLNLTLLGHYDFTQHLHATWEGWYARGTASSQVGQGTWSTPQFDNPLTPNLPGNPSSYYTDTVVIGAYQLSTSNPYLTSAERQTIQSALVAAGKDPSKFYLDRLNQDLDAGLYQTTVQMFRFAGGLNGDFDAVGRNFQWSLKGEYSRYMNDTWTPSIVVPNLINALNATTDASGNIICAPGYTSAPIKTRSSTCAPLNPFGYNQLTPAARDYVVADSHATNQNAQRDLQAEIRSTVVHLPAGDVRWDIGYEHRRESYNFQPGAFLQGWKQDDGSYQQYGNSTVIYPTTGSYLTHEAYGELDVPLVSPNMHLPGAYSLSAQANGRFIHNSMTGNFWTYMFGGSWWPTRDFGLSGNYARSVRNPSVSELFSPVGTDYESGIDPCSTEGITQGPNPATRAANCAKAGIKQPFDSNYNYFTITGQAGGNPHLKNEVSDSYTGSLEFMPHFVPGLDFKGSFVDVKIKNAITSLTSQDLMDACYDSSSYGPSNPYCSAFSRDSGGQVNGFMAGYYNIAQYHTQAMQADLRYYTALSRFGLSENAGEIELHANYMHYIKSNQSYLGNTYQLVGDTTSPSDNATFNLNYMHGPLSVQWQAIFYGPAKYALQVPSSSYQFNNRPAYAYHNVTIGYEITKNFSANFMINNIMDSRPKYPGTVSLTRYYDALLGRAFELSLGAHF